MNNDLNNISAKRYMLIRNILDSSENKKFYNEMDALLLKNILTMLMKHHY